MKKVDRLRETEDSLEEIETKCATLADMLRRSRCTVVYTGAGISTAASIPDYRGPNGVWTLAEQGKTVSGCGDPVNANPTTSHMALKELIRRDIATHILSQNCDGLHLRSGIPQRKLSEIHGNMHIEVCTNCKPPRQYIRPFDVTKKSQFRRHGTGRVCEFCRGDLLDTIVHFGEVGRTDWPLNWKGTTSLLEDAEVILCLGTSLAVLKQYEFLWPKRRPHAQVWEIIRSGGLFEIAIVNLQWTPKDRLAALKINAKCDTVMERLMSALQLPISPYCRNCDPVLHPRRAARVSELMTRLADCMCQSGRTRRVATPVEIGDGGGMPGWWAVGVARTLKRNALSTNAIPRGKRRKNSVSSSSESDSRSLPGGQIETFQVSDQEINDLMQFILSTVCHDTLSA